MFILEYLKDSLLYNLMGKGASVFPACVCVACAVRAQA